MAQFGWAYIDCDDVSDPAKGPTGSVQLHHADGDLTGSEYLVYHSSSTTGYDPNTLVLSGNLIVTGAISASIYHVEDIAIIDATGSTYFGDDQTDIHARTGSLEVYSDSALIFKANAINGQTTVGGLQGTYKRVTTTPFTASVSQMVLGVDTGNSDVTICMPSASSAGAGAVMFIKDQSTRTSSRIYISGSTGGSQELIDSASYYILSGTYPAINLYSDGLNWWIF
tara:strand:+ start:256 stop:933 length:678 start_codon:yes stop_codon:yes gene_type:complete